MTVDIAASYDELPYGDKVFAQTHPNVLATVAALSGMRPTPLTRCRVLELGCGSGGNLLPLAISLPEAEFVGIDLSPRQIAQGQQTQATLGVHNLELRVANILEVDGSYGRFDYILCHGVFSWVPPEVQDRILGLCRDLLTPQGVAYISYNTYPGWHFRGMLRDFLGYHCRKVQGIQAQVAAARGFLQFLNEALPPSEYTYANVLRTEIDVVAPTSDSYVYHEHLEAYNEPLYFHQFMARAQKHGLQYVGEAEPDPIPSSLTDEALEKVRAMSDNQIEAEQYIDFLAGRGFRRTLLTHREVAVSREVNLDRLLQMSFSTLAGPTTKDPCWGDDSAVEFETQGGVKLSSNNPVVKLAMNTLCQSRPRPVPLAELAAVVRGSLAHPPPVGEGVDPVLRVLSGSLLRFYQSHLVEMHYFKPLDTQDVSDRPLASLLARFQARSGQERLTTLRNQLVETDPFDRLLLPYLDGSRDLAALVDAMRELVRRDVFEINYDGQVVTEEQTMRAILEAWTRQSLERIARGSLLLA